jgi:ABC-type multidrug transport system, ATPase component
MDCILQTFGLSKSYKNSNVVNNVNISVQKGEIYGFIGKNGAGKTTTIRMILNLIKPSDGRSELFGEETNDKNMYKHLRKIGAIIEIPGFYLNLTGRENLDIHRIMMDIDDKTSIDRALKIVGLSGEKDKKVSHYSLGMKQRLGIARAMLHNPDFLILDEPTNGLDPQGIVEIRDMLTDIAKQGKTIFISSHILSEVEKLVSRIGILHKGMLLEEISREDFEKKCEQSLLYRVNETERAAALIRNLINTDVVSVTENSITIKTSQTEMNSKITKLLIENGFEVLESRINRSSLEDYFISLTGGESHE